MKRVFQKSAVHVAARDGLEKVTTKAIAREAGLNEAYIYKCFSGKDELLEATLHMEDAVFACFLHQTLPVMHDTRLSWKERAFVLWKRSWDFILEERDDCIFYIRFYFPPSGLAPSTAGTWKATSLWWTSFALHSVRRRTWIC